VVNASLEQVVELLEQGAGSVCISRLTGKKSHIILRVKKKLNIPNAEKSEIYPLITLFSEKRLRVAAEQQMNIKEARTYSGMPSGFIKGFWRVIGHDYFTPDQHENIPKLLEQGLSRYTIANITRLNKKDIDYFTELRS